jgi:glycosyltransferase involved in cell wall biosynthesis
MKIFTWNVHGGYLSMFSKLNYELYIPYTEGRPYNYDGKTPGYEWSDNVYEISYNQINNINYDIILYQTAQHVMEEQYRCLSQSQINDAYKIYIVHSPINDFDLVNKNLGVVESHINEQMNLIVHIAEYTKKQWAKYMPSLSNKSIVIYHSIPLSNIVATYSINRAVCAINDIGIRADSGRDEIKYLLKKIGIDLYGKNTEMIGGYGSIPRENLMSILSQYSIYINPTVHNSLPMTVLEAMSIGLPVIALNTTDLHIAITDGIEGYLCNTVDDIIDKYNYLLNNKSKIQGMGINAREKIKNYFSFDRFEKSWNSIILEKNYDKE